MGEACSGSWGDEMSKVVFSFFPANFVLRCAWGVLVVCLGVLRCAWACLGVLGVCLGCAWVCLGCAWGVLRCAWGVLGVYLGVLGCAWGVLGVSLFFFLHALCENAVMAYSVKIVFARKCECARVYEQ